MNSQPLQVQGTVSSGTAVILFGVGCVAVLTLICVYDFFYA